MTCKGDIHHRALVLDQPLLLPEGAAGTVEILTPADMSAQDRWTDVENQQDKPGAI